MTSSSVSSASPSAVAVVFRCGFVDIRCRGGVWCGEKNAVAVVFSSADKARFACLLATTREFADSSTYRLMIVEYSTLEVRR